MFSSERTKDRIEEDLQVLTEMAEELPGYLTSTAVYYPLSNPAIKLSLGSLLMRQERLLALREELSATDKNRLDKAVSQFQHAVDENQVRVEQKGHEEAHLRLRQWDRAVTELQEAPQESASYYTTIVENRVMLEAIIAHLQQAPYRFDEGLLAETAVVDQKLSGTWQGGEFVWPEVWQGAYPINTHWWLYGEPVVSQ